MTFDLGCEKWIGVGQVERDYKIDEIIGSKEQNFGVTWGWLGVVPT